MLIVSDNKLNILFRVASAGPEFPKEGTAEL